MTVLGRVTIVKTLIIPKFNHLVLSIPNPSSECLKDLQNQIYDIVWKNKKYKTSREQLSNDFPDGGLRLPKVDIFFNALKCTWIRCILNANIDERGLTLFSLLTNVNCDDLEKGASHTLKKATNTKNVF